MAIDDNTIYGLYGSQIKDLPEKINAVKGLAKELTADDYNANSSNWSDTDPTNFNCVALWKLLSGLYYVGSGVAAYIDKGGTTAAAGRMVLVDSTSLSDRSQIALFGHNNQAILFYRVDNSGSSLAGSPIQNLTSSTIVDDLTSTINTWPLSAKQGKVLKGLIDGISQSGAGAPTSSTTGTVGQLYQDTTNGKLYICTAITPGTDPDPDTYTWVEVGAGGSGIIELTSADYNWPETGNKDGIAFWLLGPGVYVIKEANMKEYYSTTSKSNLSQNSLILMGQTEFVSNQPKYSYIVWTPDGEGYSSPYFVKMVSGTISSTKLSPTVVQATGTSATDVMSQNAVTSMVFADPSTRYTVRIGASSSASSTSGVALGCYTAASGNKSVAVGEGATVSTSAQGSVALGTYSSATQRGEVAIGTSGTSYGYNNSNYRLLTGLYDPQSDHDAATKGYVDIAVAGAGADAFTNNEWNTMWA